MALIYGLDRNLQYRLLLHNRTVRNNQIQISTQTVYKYCTRCADCNKPTTFLSHYKNRRHPLRSIYTYYGYQMEFFHRIRHIDPPIVTRTSGR
jgi:hypothetical protein